jgi:hypothetical protein
MGRAKSYAERTSEFPEVGPLPEDAPRRATAKPARPEGVEIRDAALRYIRAMAALGAGPHRSGDIAEKLDRGVTSLGPMRSQLISRGMIWSPNHGDTAFTVPLFDEFMQRIMLGDDWRQ